MIPRLQPTSKAALKQQCLMIANGDIDKASKVYDFMIKDMEDLPMFDAVPPTILQQVRETAAQTVSWVNENKENIMDWVGIIKGIFSKNPAAAPAPSTPLPPIN